MADYESKRKARLQFLYGVGQGNGQSGTPVQEQSFNIATELEELRNLEAVDEDEEMMGERVVPMITPRSDRRTSFSNCSAAWSGGVPRPPSQRRRTISVSAPGTFAEEDDDKKSESEPKNSNFQTLANFIKTNVGTGVLSLPHAFKNAGLALGTVATLAIGLLCTYTMHQLLTAFNNLDDGTHMDYADVMEKAFVRSKITALNKLAKVARYTLITFIMLAQFGAIIIYIVFIGTMTKEIFQVYLPDYGHYAVEYFICLATLVALPCCYITTLKIIALFSMISNFITIACLLVIFQFLVRNSQPLENMKLVSTDQSELLMYFGTSMFAFACAPVVLPLRKHMKTPDAYGRWNGVISLGMAIVMCLYAAVGFYGFLCFGMESMLILRNLPNHWLYQSVKIAWTLTIFAGIMVNLYVVVHMTYPTIKDKIKYKWLKVLGEYIWRTFLVLITFGLAISVPCLEQLIALVGSLSASSLAITIPAILELLTEMPMKPALDATVLKSMQDNSTMTMEQRAAFLARKKMEHKRQNIYLVSIRSFFIVIIGIFGAVVGTYIAVLEIIKQLNSPNGCG